MQRIALLFILALTLVACGGNPTVDTDLGIKGAPDWVNRGTQVVDDDDGRLIYGVGMAQAMNDRALQKSTADNRARAEISRMLQTYIDSTLEDYSANSQSANSASSQSNIERVIRSSSQLALSGAKIMGHWKDEKTGDVYAFAALDMAKLDELLGASEQLSGDFKAFYEQNQGAGFERFLQQQNQ